MARRVRVVHDRLVSHEQTDHVRKLTRVAEVDRMGGSLDDREHDSVRGAAGDLLDSGRGWAWSGSRSPMTARVGTFSASNRSNDGYWVRARNILTVLETPNLR